MPWMISGIISCSEIVEKSVKPVTVDLVGELLPGVSYSRPAPVYLDKNAVAGVALAWLDEQLAQSFSEPRPIRLFRISNGLVFGQGSVALPDRRLLSDSCHEFTNHGHAPDGAYKVGDRIMLLHDQNRRSVPGTSILVKRPWYRNFGHWFVDLMPILPLISEAGIEVDNIIFGDVREGPLRAMMTTTATHLYPSAKIIFMSDTEQLRPEVLYYVEPLHVPPLFKHPLSIQATIDAAKRIFGGARVRSDRLIYLSRQRCGGRKISNSEALEALLASYGFETIFPEEHPFAQQLAIFEQADVIVGPKGAAFANAIFCKSGTDILLLSPPEFVDCFYWDLLSRFGIAYSEIFCHSSKGPRAHPAHQDLQVDLASVEHFLKKINFKGAQ